MLKSFSVKNYKNFKDEIRISFDNVRDYSFNTNCTKNGLLNKMLIFGNNASGKSNLGYALFDIVGVLTDNRIANEQQRNLYNADSPSKIMEFYYKFQFGQDIVDYNYKKEESYNNIIFEELYINKELIYQFDYSNKKLSENSNLEKINASSLNVDFSKLPISISLLRVIANNTIQEENGIVKKIEDFAKSMLLFKSLQQNDFIGLEKSGTVISDWIVKNGLIDDFNNFINKYTSINSKLKAETFLNNIVIFEEHKSYSLDFTEVSSSGTKALTVFYFWYKNLERIKFLYVDEFDAFYHFDLSINIMKLILEHTDIQVILTSHNTILADNDLMRPDCYYILNNGKLVSFADSTERELRQGHNLEKMMRQGEFNVES